MGIRGRQSLSVIAEAIDAHKRPAPPAHMPRDAAAEWCKVVEMMPTDWFPPETHALLEDRCNHVIWQRKTARTIEEMIKPHGKLDVKKYHDLMKLAIYQSRTLAMLDSKMRLTQQSTYDKSKSKRIGRTRTEKKAPWQTAAE